VGACRGEGGENCARIGGDSEAKQAQARVLGAESILLLRKVGGDRVLCKQEEMLS
jgi:hypothetical protein